MSCNDHILTDGHKHINNEEIHTQNIVNIISDHFKDQFITTIFSYTLSDDPDSVIPNCCCNYKWTTYKYC